MAKQRTTTVNIDYKVNTVDVERGNQLLNRASTATDNLRKTTDTASKQMAQGYRFTSKAIEGMEIEVARLRQQVKLASTQNVADVQRLSAQYKSAKAQLDQYNRSLLQTAAASKQASQSSQTMAQQFGQVYTAIKLFIAAGLARELVNMSLSAATLTGNIEGVERAFMRAFPGGKAILLDLRESTRGAVSDFELMQRTLQATNLGVSVEHLAVLFEFAATRAQQTGESVDYLVDSIVRGIGRKSILVLDNLGLSATRLREQFNGAAIASKSVAEVTEGVAEIARVELAKMGGFLETSATQVSQLGVSWKGLREEIAAAMTADDGGGIVGFMKDYVDSFRVLIKAFNEGRTVADVFAEQQREQIALVSANEFISRTFTENKKENIKILKDEVQAITEDLGVYARFRDQIEKVVAEQKEELKGMGALPSLRQKERIDLQETIALNERILDSKKNDAQIDQQILKILQSKLLALTAIKKVETPDGEGEGGRGMLMKPLTQTVDIRFKDPKTGAITKEHTDKVLQDFIDDAQKVLDAMPLRVAIEPDIIRMSEWEKALNRNRDEIINTSANIISDIVQSAGQREIDSYTERIEAARSFYGEQIALAGDNERAKEEFRIKEAREIKKLEKERADREKKAAKAGILVNTALGIMKAFATAATVYDGIIQAALVAAQGATQFAIASKARYYAKGEIDIKGGTPGKDSIPAMLTPHESIMTADETKSSSGILKAVRAKRLNDKVLQEIVSGRSGGSAAGAFDDSRLLKKLDEVKNATPDITKRANLVYETRKQGDKYKKTVRSKSMGL